MVEFRIPAEIAPYWDQIVSSKYHNDEEQALLDAVMRFVDKEKSELVDAERFDMEIKKVNERRLNTEKIVEDEFSSAFAKRQRRMEKARELFGKIGQSDEKA